MSTMVIDGKPASARSGATVEIHDPATGERVDTVPQAGVEETRQAIDAAHAAFRGWAETRPQKRTQILMKGAILPSTFPLTPLANTIAPALAVGTPVVAKPASSTPLSTIRLVELMNEGGLPPGVLNVVVGPGAVVGQELIKNPKVRKIGFTG